jgi:predicted ArsR family transcriptional regulator
MTFTRKTLREAIGWSDWQVRTHIKELETMEYIQVSGGSQGKQYNYSLEVSDMLNETDRGSVGMVLTDPDTLREPDL